MAYHYDFDCMDDFLMAESIEDHRRLYRRRVYLHNLLVWGFCGLLTGLAGYGATVLIRATYHAIRLWVRP